jgi:hypothetical protein
VVSVVELCMDSSVPRTIEYRNNLTYLTVTELLWRKRKGRLVCYLQNIPHNFASMAAMGLTSQPAIG